MKTGAHPQTDWKTKCPPKYLQGLLNGVAVLFFPRGADAAVGWEEYSGCVANSTMARFAVSGYALRAHQTRTMKIGDITRGKRVLRAIFASLQWRNIRSAKRCWPRVLRGTAITPAQWNAEVAPVGFICAAPKVSCGAGCGISGLGNALQISPPPLQRSFRSYNTLAKPEICSGKTLFLPNGPVGRPYRTLGAMRSVAGKTARSEKIRLSAQNEMRVAAARIRAFGLSANPEIPRGGRAGFCGARAGAGDGLASEQVVVRPPASAVF